MTKEEYIAAIREVSIQGADALEGYLKPNPISTTSIRADAIGRYNDPAVILQSSMVWSETTEGHRFWTEVQDRLYALDAMRRTAGDRIQSKFSEMVDSLPKVDAKTGNTEPRVQPGNTEPNEEVHGDIWQVELTYMGTKTTSVNVFASDRDDAIEQVAKLHPHAVIMHAAKIPRTVR
jgi:hypothetical protein